MSVSQMQPVRRPKSVLAVAIASILLSAMAQQAHAQESEPKKEAESGEATQLSDIEVSEDPRRFLPTEVSSSSFGFSKPLLETPRSVSFVSQEQIDLFGLSAVEDLVRLVPGTFTTTRFGIQGGIDVRNVAADTYLRGMKRLSLQGHGRTVLAAMDTIEVVKGPPSPIYGMGKIGGYTNMVPKSGRAKTGGYLTQATGFAQMITGSYDRSEWSAGVGGPVSIMNKNGGFYLYGLLEDSASFTQGVPVEQRIGQGALSLDEFVGPFRLEAGVNTQKSRTAGALTGRFNQALVDDGTYIRGTPLVNMDLDGSGGISYYEQFQASPVRGRVSSTNQPLIQNWAWPTDGNGQPLRVEDFPTVPGIPENMVTYLNSDTGRQVANCRAADIMRQIGATQTTQGPVPSSGAVPVGFFLNPCTVGYDKLDTRRAAAFEREVRAQFNTAYIDLVYDTNPDFTMKNQIFFDNMNQHKLSNQACCGPQDVYIWEDKFTISKRLTKVPEWLKMNSLASINIRYTEVETYSGWGGDWGTHRTDAMADTWIDRLGGMTANTMFVNSFDNSDINNGGSPITAHERSSFWESGLGVMFDMDFFEKTNLLIGGRYDYSGAKYKSYAGYFTATTGTSANPGAVNTTETKTSGKDGGTSYSVSLSHQLPYGIRPYATYARSSISLDGNNNALSANIIDSGHIGQAELKEFGVKTSMFDNKLFLSLANYKQTRLNVTNSDDDSAVAGAYASSTITDGWELEAKWVPMKSLFLSAFGLKQKTKFDPNLGGTLLVDARLLGFQDVLDPDTGEVLFPAEAFLYGGRSRIVLPDGVEAYETKSGNPEYQAGLTATYSFDAGLGFTLSGNYFGEVCTGRLCWVELPEYYIGNAGMFFDKGRWHLKMDVYNFTNEKYWKPRTGDTLGDVLAQAMPDRRFQFTFKVDF